MALVIILHHTTVRVNTIRNRTTMDTVTINSGNNTVPVLVVTVNGVVMAVVDIINKHCFTYFKKKKKIVQEYKISNGFYFQIDSWIKYCFVRFINTKKKYYRVPI